MRGLQTKTSSFLVALLGASLLFIGCRPAPAPPSGNPPKAMLELKARLETAGLSVSELEALRSLRELPECSEAEFRWRVHLGGGGFANVSRFRSAREAFHCGKDFESMALKGGTSAWERLRRDIAVHDAWLVLFPPDKPGDETRRRFVEAVETMN